MCKNCDETRERIKSDVAALLAGDEDNELFKAIERNLPEVLEAVNRRIDAVEESAREEGDEEFQRPDDESVENAVRDTLIGAILATAGASLAAHTPGYTDEGQVPPSMVLGTWAGVILQNEIAQQEAAQSASLVRHLLGMGDN